MKRRLRAPFVVTTVAVLSAASAGCGGVVVEKSAPSECPASAPTNGDPCTGSTSCSYGACSSGNATCVDGKWQVEYGSCNPPPPLMPECAIKMPHPGDSCGTGICTWFDDCTKQQVTLSCVDNQWTGTLPAPSCPAVQPVNGASCDACVGRYPHDCTYDEGTCAGYPQSSDARCDSTGKWNVSISTCNPPAPMDAGTP